MSEILRTDFCVRLTNSTRFIFHSSLDQFCCVHNQIRFGCQQYVQPVKVEASKTCDYTKRSCKTHWKCFFHSNIAVDVMCQGWLVIDLFLFPNTPVFEQQNNRREDKDEANQEKGQALRQFPHKKLLCNVRYFRGHEAGSRLKC